jgi:hypothetical protein
VPGAPGSADRRRRLSAACQWLWVLNTSVEAARRAAPVPAADRDLPAAIPVNALPTAPCNQNPNLDAGSATTAPRSGRTPGRVQRAVKHVQL